VQALSDVGVDIQSDRHVRVPEPLLTLPSDARRRTARALPTYGEDHDT
jgi:hypothetical protein